LALAAIAARRAELATTTGHVEGATS
jgi:hypothetical protein